MQSTLAVTPQEAAAQLGYADASSVWILLAKICPITGQRELESPEDQPVPSKATHRAGRLITQQSIDEFRSRHHRSAGGSWLHQPPKEARTPRPDANDSASAILELKFRIAELHEEHGQDRAEYVQKLKAAALENSQLALDLKLAQIDLDEKERSFAKQSKSFDALDAAMTQLVTPRDIRVLG